MNDRKDEPLVTGKAAVSQWHGWRGDALALVATAAVFGLRYLLSPWVGDDPLLILFVIPILLSAYVGGLRAGLLCTGLVGAATAYLVLQPSSDFILERPRDVVQWLLLLLLGATISVLSDELHRTRADRRPGRYEKYVSTERKVQTGFALALACLAAIGIVSYLSVVQLTGNSAMVTHTQEVTNGLDRLLLAATEAETAQRGYVITGNDTHLTNYARAKKTVNETLRTLRDKTADNAEQQQRLAGLQPLLDERLAVSDAVLALRRTDGFPAEELVQLSETGRRLREQLRTRIAESKAIELGLLAQREERTRSSTLIAKAVIVGGGVLAFALVGLALLLIRRDFEARRRAEAELDRFFSLSLDFLCISSADGYFKRVSPAVTDILGWSVEEFLRKPFLDFVHPDDHAATMQEVEKQVVAGEKVLHFENRYLHENGSWRVLAWRSMPQPDGLMYATARDVTELRANEALLRAAKDELETRVAARTSELAQANEWLLERERRFRALIENGADSIALVDIRGKILYLSPAVRSVEGYEPGDLIGQSTLQLTHPDDIARVRETMQRLLAQPGKPLPVLWRRRHKSGRWIWLEGMSTNMLSDPAVAAIVTNYRDVTDRINADARLQAQVARLALLSQITRAIAEHQDLRSIFQVVVRSLEEQLPLDFVCLCLHTASAGQLTVNCVGARHRSLALELAMVEHASIEIDDNGLSRCVRGEVVYEPDLRAVPFPFPRRLAGAGLNALVAAPLLSESKVFGVLIAARREAASFSSTECEFLRQLSEHVALAAHQAQLYGSLQEAYQELRRTQEAVMQQERLRVLGQMASGIAHDINNAVSPIALYTELLLEREPNLTQSGRGHLQTIRRAIEDVAETVARMREFYRQRESQIPLVPVQLNALVPQVIELTRARWADMPQLRGAAIEVTTNLAAGLPLIVGTESEIREALTNLIFNAVDAMPDGGTLSISTCASAASDKVELEVADTGIGMDEETRRRCLELFFTTKGERGTGLGLAMVYGMVERHGAEIVIDSEPGQGTRVRLAFPVREVTHTAAPPAATHSHPSELHVLVVDDDPVLLKSMSDTLGGDGYTIVTAKGGQEGIDAFRAGLDSPRAFDLVITDLGMPSVDGRRVANAVKTASPSTPVIMLTGWGQRMVNDGELPANVDRVLSKPPRLADLRGAMAELTSIREPS